MVLAIYYYRRKSKGTAVNERFVKEESTFITSNTTAATLVLLVLFAMGIGRQAAASPKEDGMRSPIIRADGRDMRPAIDRSVPARTETATFALG